MAGFLDKKSRVVDMVLTGYGKSLLTKGELRFAYWSAFDDEVDYDPFIAESGSLSEEGLEEAVKLQIENLPIREATTGYRYFNLHGSDGTNVLRPLFDVAQGQTVLPRMNSSAPDELTVEIRQQPVSDGYRRFDPTVLHLEYGFGGNDFPPDSKLEGFLVRVYKSGSDGLVEQKERLDSTNNTVFGGDLVLDAEEE